MSRASVMRKSRFLARRWRLFYSFALVPGALGIGSAQELLKDGDLELSTPNGTFPSSGFWQPAYLGEAGSIVIANAGVTGNAFYLYTGNATNDFWTGPYQEIPTIPGQAFDASAYIRSPIGNTQWVAGTRARVHVAFLDANTNVLNSFESPALTNRSTVWQKYQVTTEAAPDRTAFVRYMCILEKPRGTTNISVAVFDNCSLRLGVMTKLDVWPVAVGVPIQLSTTPMYIRNLGNTAIVWHATNGPPWLTVAPASGVLAPGNQQTLQATVNRLALTGSDCIRSSFAIDWTSGTTPIRLFVEMPAAPVPNQPALAHVDGYRVVVQDRLPDGGLTPAYNYTVKGATWSPASRDTADIFDIRRAEFAKWYVTDVQLLRELNANTVYTFLDFGTNGAAQNLLDNFYRNGIKVLVTVDENGTGNTNTVVQIVTAYRNHPAILGWVIGNEWNINLYHGLFATNGYYAAAAFTEQMARMIKQLDTNHFVLSTHGDIYPPEMSTLANVLCPSVDVWGLNAYRGPSFTSLFDDWSGVTTRPMMLTEFGTDAYRTLLLKVNDVGAITSADGAEDEPMQAQWERTLWREIAGHLSADNPRGVCLGATAFEWNDEWWKAQFAFGGQVGWHDTLGFYASWNPGSHPDGVANEEYWGLVTVDRQPRMSYRFFQEDFAAVRAAIQHTNAGNAVLSWPARSNVVYTVFSHDGDLTTGAPFLPLAPLTNLTTVSNTILRVMDTNSAAAQGRFYRVTAQPR